jgi:hypothetical protein
VKAGNERLMGFGHRVYKNHDPRATIIKKACDDVFEVTGVNPLLKIAVELERIALEDEYFVSRKLYPNVDFYSGLIYEALQFPPEMFTVLFAIPRTSGWLAQWIELVGDKEQKIAGRSRSTPATGGWTSRLGASAGPDPAKNLTDEGQVSQRLLRSATHASAPGPPSAVSLST